MFKKKQCNDFLLCYLRFRIEGRTSIYKYIHILYHLCIPLPFWKDSGMISYCVSYGFEFRKSLLLYIIIFVYISICTLHWMFWKDSGMIFSVLFTFLYSRKSFFYIQTFSFTLSSMCWITFLAEKNSLMISYCVINISVLKEFLFLYTNIFVYLIICVSHCHNWK